MANNFRLTGDVYISKDGDDADTGLTADDPKLTLDGYGVAAIVVGSGQYEGAFSLTDNVKQEFEADNTVKVVATADLLVGNSGASNRGKTFHRFIFELETFNLENRQNTGTNIYYDCIVKNGNFTSASGGRAHFERSVLEDMTGTINAIGTGDEALIVDSAIFNSQFSFDTTTNSRKTLKNSYIDAASIITTAVAFDTAEFVNNNIQGIITVAGTQYELKKERDGTAIDPNPAIADYVTIDATVYDRGNFSQDPEYLNLSKRDYFSVDESSPHLFGGDTGQSIAASRFAVLQGAADADTLTDLVVSSGDLIYDTGAGTGVGVATFPALQIAPIAQQIERVDMAELLNFDSLQTIGGVDNQNVVALLNPASGSAGASPRRLTYEMRWSIADAMPTTASEWDNQTYVTAGAYSVFEHFTAPMIDVNGIGNGDPAFIVAGATQIAAKWVQIRITIQEGIG